MGFLCESGADGLACSFSTIELTRLVKWYSPWILGAGVPLVAAEPFLATARHAKGRVPGPVREGRLRRIGNRPN
jgi:hypothetical protein